MVMPVIMVMLVTAWVLGVSAFGGVLGVGLAWVLFGGQEKDLRSAALFWAVSGESSARWRERQEKSCWRCGRNRRTELSFLRRHRPTLGAPIAGFVGAEVVTALQAEAVGEAMAVAATFTGQEPDSGHDSAENSEVAVRDRDGAIE